MGDLDSGLVMGIDGGQTSTKCVLATTEGRILGYGCGGPLTHLATQGGRERYQRAVGEAVHAAWAAAGLAPRPVEAIGVGLTGVEAKTPEAAIATEVLSTIVPAHQYDVQSDATIALLGAHHGHPGVVVLSGTGTIALGMDRHGRLARAGGWGWLIGDEGSAYAIGRAGLQAALYAFDGMGPPTALQDAFAHHFGITDMRDIKRIIFAPEFGAPGFAALAPIVSKVAQEGDPLARHIIRRAGSALAREATAVIRCLDFGSEQVPIAPVGGAFDHVTGLRAAFTAAVQACCACVVVPAMLPPVLGAVILALQKYGADVDQALAHLRDGVAIIHERG